MLVQYNTTQKKGLSLGYHFKVDDKKLKSKHLMFDDVTGFGVNVTVGNVETLFFGLS